MNGRAPYPELVLRTVDRGDLDAVAAAYRSLSTRSLYQRFFTVMPDPTPLVARHLASVDHHDHEALVVEAAGRVVAMAQWDRSSADQQQAEVAIVVVDAWQRRGLGRALTRALAASAHREGITTLVASVLSDNRAGTALASGFEPAGTGLDGSETHYRFPLAS
jgi:L-amino acid N-acyltransferase YncA